MIEEMDMPCPCDCGAWFELSGGYTVEGSDRMICEDCHQSEEKRHVTIGDLKSRQKFILESEEFYVLRKFIAGLGYLIAEGVNGKQKFFDEDVEVVIFLD